MHDSKSAPTTRVHSDRCTGSHDITESRLHSNPEKLNKFSETDYAKEMTIFDQFLLTNMQEESKVVALFPYIIY